MTVVGTSVNVITRVLPNHLIRMVFGLSSLLLHACWDTGTQTGIALRIDYCDDHLIQESSYISGAIHLIHTNYISYEAQYFSLSDHTHKNNIKHIFRGK